MAGKLANEIKQRGFGSAAQEAALNILRTAQVLEDTTGEFLREFGLTGTQYNVLRILRGAGAGGMACSQIAERMITHDPDITRLLDRLEANRLVMRERSTEDRRVVMAKITDDALALLCRMDKPMVEQMNRTLGTLPADSLASLIGLLERVRESLV